MSLLKKETFKTTIKYKQIIVLCVSFTYLVYTSFPPSVITSIAGAKLILMCISAHPSQVHRKMASIL